MSRRSNARRERLRARRSGSFVVQLAAADREGRVRLSALLWSGPEDAHRYVSLSPAAAVELAEELARAARDAQVIALGEAPEPEPGVLAPARAAAQPGARAIHPGVAVEYRR